MENIMTRQLQSFVSERTFIDIFMDQWNETLWGYLHAFTPDYLLLEVFNGDCVQDGIAIIQRDIISRIKWDSNETRAAALIAAKKSPMTGLEDIDLSSTYAILTSTEEMFGHLTVHTDHLDSNMLMIGTIREIDAEHLVLHEYGTRSSLAARGMILLPLANITRVSAGSIYANSILHTSRNSDPLRNGR